MKTLDNGENMFGKISPVIKKEIKEYINNPSFDQWDKIAHYIISPIGQIKTIWNAIVDIDSTFPRTGRAEDSEGNIVREWERIPEPLLVLQAIKYVTSHRPHA